MPRTGDVDPVEEVTIIFRHSSGEHSVHRLENIDYYDGDFRTPHEQVNLGEDKWSL